MDPIATMRTYMEKHSLTQAEMARLLHVSQPSVSRYLSGAFVPGTTAADSLRHRLRSLTK